MPYVRAAVLLATLALLACNRDARLPQQELAGAAMGTTWSVKLVAPPDALSPSALTTEIDAMLSAFEDVASTYRRNSELSRFNAARTTDWVEVSPELCRLTEGALAISARTGGAFDATVGPLVNLWGFGPESIRSDPPADADIDAVLDRVGHGLLQARCTPLPPALRKDRADVYVDFSGWAKGYAADQVAALLDGRALENYLVEIGGEMRLRGTNAEGRKWAVGIEKPVTGVRAPQRVIRLSDVGVATSGDYRNFFEYEGVRFSHTIDARTGRPVTHALSAVTVVAASAAEADAMATALLVLGPDDGPAMAERLDVAAYFLIRSDGGLEAASSSRFDRMVAM